MASWASVHVSYHDTGGHDGLLLLIRPDRTSSSGDGGDATVAAGTPVAGPAGGAR